MTPRRTCEHVPANPVAGPIGVTQQLLGRDDQVFQRRVRPLDQHRDVPSGSSGPPDADDGRGDRNGCEWEQRHANRARRQGGTRARHQSGNGDAKTDIAHEQARAAPLEGRTDYRVRNRRIRRHEPAPRALPAQIV